MATISIHRLRVAALLLGFVGLALAAGSAPVAAQAGSTLFAQRETPNAALARHVRVLATSPRDFAALIGAGKAALALGDTQTAVGFFGRAEEVFPGSPLPQAGMGAALVSDGDAHGALRYFSRAEQLGANAAMLGAERGLAFDLLGRHADAQADYRAALTGTDGDEARRRLALSLAITGDKAAAIDMLAPLMARGDMGAARCRALVLALSGDLEGARRSLDSAMPGSSVRMAPFFARLPSLASDQKAAAVNLGIFPNSGQPAYAYVAPQAAPAPVQGQPRPAAPAASPPRAQPQRVAGVAPQARPAAAGVPVKPVAKPRIWVQLASGSNPDALPEQFRRIKSRHRDILEGMGGYVAESGDRSRLLIGPFRSMSDANIVVADLETVRVNAFSWTSPPGQMIRKLASE